jgi:NitT/TauT family transport system ATP-binding protein
MEVSNISQRYGDRVIFDNFSYVFPENKVTVILGHSGVGKSTLLKIISGTIKYDGEVINSKGKGSIVYAEQRLLPNLTVINNLHYIMKGIERDKLIRTKLIENTLEELDILKYKDTYPQQLSTGMAQRVALARAFLFPSKVMLMDEPFRGLDIGMRVKLIDKYTQMWQKNHKTVIWVTHDVNEAILLAHRLIIIGGAPAKIIYEENINIPHHLRYSDENINYIHSKIINFCHSNIF